MDVVRIHSVEQAAGVNMSSIKLQEFIKLSCENKFCGWSMKLSKVEYENILNDVDPCISYLPIKQREDCIRSGKCPICEGIDKPDLPPVIGKVKKKKSKYHDKKFFKRSMV